MPEHIPEHIPDPSGFPSGIINCERHSWIDEWIASAAVPGSTVRRQACGGCLSIRLTFTVPVRIDGRVITLVDSRVIEPDFRIKSSVPIGDAVASPEVRRMAEVAAAGTGPEVELEVGHTYRLSRRDRDRSPIDLLALVKHDDTIILYTKDGGRLHGGETMTRAGLFMMARVHGLSIVEV
jgi:hypothetical protein